MPRPHKDGTPAKAPNKRVLSELYIQKLQRKPPARPTLTWDTKQAGLALSVQPSGHISYKAIYSYHGRARWYTIGDHNKIGLAAARKLVREVLYEVAKGKDPQSERKAQRSQGTFAELATRYVEEYSKKANKSWKQADLLVKKHLVPKWGQLRASDISRSDVKMLMTRIQAPIVANQTLAAASAIFAWAIKNEIVKENPCRLVQRNETKSRERVLSDSEVPLFWAAFDDGGLLRSSALKMILLTGQRPGEVLHMRFEHIVDGWWTMPGDPVPALHWPGTKNGQSHRVWLPAPVRALIKEVHGGDEPTTGLVFGSRKRTITKLDAVMKSAWQSLGVERVTPHDLRRTHGTMVTRLQFGRDAMNRIQNHREGGIASVYDQHSYADENKKVMETVAAAIMALVTGTETNNVITPTFGARQL